MRKAFLSLAQCPQHGVQMISLDDEEGCGTRITPGKCCGQWLTAKKWPMSVDDLREAAELFSSAAEELEHEA